MNFFFQRWQYYKTNILILSYTNAITLFFNPQKSDLFTNLLCNVFLKGFQGLCNRVISDTVPPFECSQTFVPLHFLANLNELAPSTHDSLLRFLPKNQSLPPFPAPVIWYPISTRVFQHFVYSLYGGHVCWYFHDIQDHSLWKYIRIYMYIYNTLCVCVYAYPQP